MSSTSARRSAEAIRDTEATPRVSPFDILEFIADDSAGAAFNAAFVGKNYGSIVLWGVTGCGAAIDALLSNATEAGLVIDDADVRPSAIDVVVIERELTLDGGGIEDLGAGGTHW